MTDRARQLLVEVESVILQSRDEMLHGLSAEQQQLLTDILQTVKTNLSQALELDESLAGAAKLESAPG